MKVGVIGAGTMGSGIAQAFAQTEGYEVCLCDINEEFAANGKAKIAKGLEKRVARGKMEQAAANSSLISHKHTSYPSVCANACAIPLPIVPAPITPTFIIIPPVKLFYYIIFRSAADTADWKYIKLHYYLFRKRRWNGYSW